MVAETRLLRLLREAKRSEELNESDNLKWEKWMEENYYKKMEGVDNGDNAAQPVESSEKLKLDSSDINNDINTENLKEEKSPKNIVKSPNNVKSPKNVVKSPNNVKSPKNAVNSVKSPKRQKVDGGVQMLGLLDEEESSEE